VAFGGHDLNVVDADGAHMFGQPFGHALNIRLVGGVSAQAGDAQHLKQLVTETRAFLS
jgi:hypothetical protein